MHLAFITPGNLGPYHLARFDALVSLGVELTVVRILSPEHFRPWKVKNPEGYRVIPPLSVDTIDKKMTPRRIHSLLDDISPDAVVVVGYGGIIYLAAAYWAKRHSVPSVLTCDSWQRSNKRSMFKELLKSIWIRFLYDVAFVAGELSAHYLNSLGMSLKNIWRGYDVVDNDFFELEAMYVFSGERETREVLDLPKDYFLYCGRISPEKNLRCLIDAFQMYRDNGEKWGLVVVGSGPGEEDIRTYAEDSVGRAITFISWARQYELARIYGLARCFVLPSTQETWGLTVNEAMAAGLPVLISRGCGCWPDLCWRGINGYDFDPLDPEALAGLMLRISSGHVDLDRMGQASRRIISNFTPETWAVTLLDCVRTLCVQGEL